MFGPIGMPELILIFVVALLIFGPKKLPEIGKSIGKGLGEFKRASEDLKRTIEQEIEQGKTEISSVREHAADLKNSLLSASRGLTAEGGETVASPEEAASEPESRPIHPA